MITEGYRIEFLYIPDETLAKVNDLRSYDILMATSVMNEFFSNDQLIYCNYCLILIPHHILSGFGLANY